MAQTLQVCPKPVDPHRLKFPGVFSEHMLEIRRGNSNLHLNSDLKIVPCQNSFKNPHLSVYFQIKMRK